MQQKIALIGSPGAGKSSVLKELIERNFYCMPEISREVTLKAQKDGIDQLFLTQPLLFSQLLLEGRERQFLNASKSKTDIVFFDRGIPDIYAYMNYLKKDYPPVFKEKSKQYRYHKIFLFKPWKEIYAADNERYETFEQALNIHTYLKKAYSELGYLINIVPFGTIKERANFILNSLKN